MDNTIAKQQNQFQFFGRPIPGFLSQFVSAYPYLSPYFNPLNPANTSWLQQASNSASGCSSPISPSSSTSGRCPICFISMQGVDANQHFLEEVQRIETFRKTKESEEKCKMDIIDVDIENRDEHSILEQLIRRNSRFTTRYQTYLKIKHNREQRKIRSYRNQKRHQDEKNLITPPGLNSLTGHQLNQLNQLNQFSLSAAAAQHSIQNNLHNNLQNNLQLLHQQAASAQHALANRSHQQHNNNANSNANSLLLNGLLLAAANCNSPATSNSNVTSCLERDVESHLGLSNGSGLNSTNSNVASLAGQVLTNSLTNSLGNSQSNGLSQDRTTPGSTTSTTPSSTPLTNLSSMNGLSVNNVSNNHLTNGNSTPTSANHSPVATTQLNGSNNTVASLHQKTSPVNQSIWSIASITGLNAAVANNLQNLNNELKRRCITDDEDEDLEITDDRDSIASDK